MCSFSEGFLSFFEKKSARITSYFSLLDSDHTHRTVMCNMQLSALFGLHLWVQNKLIPEMQGILPTTFSKCYRQILHTAATILIGFGSKIYQKQCHIWMCWYPLRQCHQRYCRIALALSRIQLQVRSYCSLTDATGCTFSDLNWFSKYCRSLIYFFFFQLFSEPLLILKSSRVWPFKNRGDYFLQHCFCVE